MHFGFSNLILILAKIMILARIKKNPGWPSEPRFFSIKIRRPRPGLGAFQIKSASPDPDLGLG